MNFQLLVDVSASLRKTRSRNQKRELLAEILRRAPPVELELVVSYLCAALPQGKIGVGPKLARELCQQAEASVCDLEVLEVDSIFTEVASIRGSGSLKRKKEVLECLFQRVTGAGQRFLTGLVLGDLRQGASESAMCEAMADVADADADEVRRAFMVTSDLPAVARVLATEGEAGLSEFRIEVFRPVLPMLAQSALDDHAALFSDGRELRVEEKLDGARIQVHKRGQEIKVYSRKRHDVTVSVPEVCTVVSELRADTAVLDGEAICLGPNGRPLPFQDTMRRFGRRKTSAVILEELPITPFFFDCLLLDGNDLTERKASERWRLLQQLLPRHLPKAEMICSEGELDSFYDSTLRAGYEGVMLKDPESDYRAGRRGASWQKLKPSTTVDLVVLAAEWGSGRRTGSLSNLHLGARSAEHFVMVGKTFKGLSDDMLAWQTAELLKRETDREGPVVYVDRNLVVEIAFSDVQRSDTYPGGLALRFARVKGYRPDKSSSEADTLESLRKRMM